MLKQTARSLSSSIKRFSDEGLTRKASLNALSSVLEYAARLLVAFITIPIMVLSLGNYHYGLWQILNRVVGYISSTSAKPSEALQWSLANHQTSDDFEQKRSFVGSTIAVWAMFFPLLAISGGILSWFLPIWLNVPPDSIWLVRITAGILVLNLIMINLAAMPRSVLIGQNLGYKRMGLSALLIFLGGGLTWISLLFGTGMVGLAIAALITTLLGAILYLLVVKKYTPWFGVAWPSSEELRKFLRLSGWFLAWDLLLNLMIASDVVVLGLLESVEAVASYTLTKYAPEMLITIVTIMVIGILPGLGKIVGTGDFKKAAQVRSEIMVLSWLILTFSGATIVLWNRVFLQLWVGEKQYAGTLQNLLIMVFVVQFAFIQNDANIINLSLRIKWKVWIGAISIILCLVLAGALINRFNLGMVGLLIGFILGRTVLSICYPALVSDFLKGKLSSQLRGALRPFTVMSILFVVAALLSDDLSRSFTLSGLQGWLIFGFSVPITASIFLLIAYYFGLAALQRRWIVARMSMVITPYKHKDV